MGKLTVLNLELLISLLLKEMDSLRGESYINDEIALKHYELGDIEWKLYSQLIEAQKVEEVLIHG